MTINVRSEPQPSIYWFLYPLFFTILTSRLLFDNSVFVHKELFRLVLDYLVYVLRLRRKISNSICGIGKELNKLECPRAFVYVFSRLLICLRSIGYKPTRDARTSNKEKTHEIRTKNRTDLKIISIIFSSQYCRTWNKNMHGYMYVNIFVNQCANALT